MGAAGRGWRALVCWSLLPSARSSCAARTRACCTRSGTSSARSQGAIWYVFLASPCPLLPPSSVAPLYPGSAISVSVISPCPIFPRLFLPPPPPFLSVLLPCSRLCISLVLFPMLSLSLPPLSDADALRRSAASPNARRSCSRGSVSSGV
ncbi:hypothetical protein B0H10DRAFT_1998481, partial [Mycena sp. CBHHK59/15]